MANTTPRFTGAQYLAVIAVVLALVCGAIAWVMWGPLVVLNAMVRWCF